MRPRRYGVGATECPYSRANEPNNPALKGVRASTRVWAARAVQDSWPLTLRAATTVTSQRETTVAFFGTSMLPGKTSKNGG